MNEHIWNYVVNKKCEITQNTFYILDSSKQPPLDYCFAHSWHSLDELHEVIT